jgi:putative DNA primase/helicase
MFLRPTLDGVTMERISFDDAYKRLGESGQLAIYDRFDGGTLQKRPTTNPVTNQNEINNPSFGLFQGEGGKIFWKHFGTDAHGDLFDFLRLVAGEETARKELGLNGEPVSIPKQKQAQSKEKTSEGKRIFAAKLWEESIPDNGPVAAYFGSRTYTSVIPESIRLNTKKKLMVARVADVDDGFLGAHRIWLTPLVLKEGEKRQKRSLGPIKGGAVRLGTPSRGRLALCEGIEDGLSIQQATNIPTWAALSTSGLKNIQVPRWVKEVWIFADSDENQAGQKAAIIAAKRLVKEGRNVWIVYPVDQGEKPEKADFNDLLHKDPTGISIRERLKKAEEIKPEIPWIKEEIPDGFELVRKGIFQLRVKKDEEELVFISGPVWIAAFTRDLQQGGWGAVVRWIDMDGRHHERAVPRQRFHEQGPVLAQELAAEGLRVIPGKENILKTYLGYYDPSARWQSVALLGWLDDPSGRLVYVHPERIYEGMENQNEKVIFQPERYSPTAKTIRTKGSLEEWQRHVVELCKGNPILIFSICASFAGALLKSSGLDSGGFNIYGDSSGGKTTTAQIAATVWGCGADPGLAPDMAYVRKWNATANAVEGLAAAHSDGLLILDELQTCSAKDFGKLIYDLTGGQGKVAMDASRNLKAQRSWRIMLFSTGEMSVREKIEREGGIVKAGQLIRVLDILTTDLFPNPHGLSKGGFADKLKAECSQYFGTAGPAFLEKLIQTFSDSIKLRSAISGYLRALTIELTPNDAKQAQARAIRRFALVGVAGKLAVRFGVLPLSEEEVSLSVKSACQSWWSEIDAIPDAVRGVEAVREFILKHHESRFGNANSASHNRTGIQNQAGYMDRANELYLFSKDGFIEACGGHNITSVARELFKLGLIIKDGRSFVSRHNIPGLPGRPRWYAIKTAILEDQINKENNHDG